MPHYPTPSDYVYQVLTPDQVDLMRRLDLVTEYAITSQFLDRALQNVSGSLIIGTTAVSPTGLNGLPTQVLYIKLDGTVWSDQNMIRNSATNDTLIKKVGTTFNSVIDIGDALGFGFDHVLMNISDPISTAGTNVAVVDGAILGLPDTAAIITTDDSTFTNGSTNIFHHSVMDLGMSNVNTNELFQFAAGISGGSINGFRIRYDNPGGFDCGFLGNQFGVGWANFGSTFAWLLPLTGPTAGQVLGSTAGLPSGGQLEWINSGGGGSLVVNSSPVTGAPTLPAILYADAGGILQSLTNVATWNSGPVTEVLYFDSTGGTQTSDSEFARMNTNHDTLITSTLIEAGYTVGMLMGTTFGAPNTLAYAYIDNINNIGSINFIKKDQQLFQTKNQSGAPQIRSYLHIDLTTLLTPLNELGTFDSAGPNAGGFVRTFLTKQENEFQYNYSGALGNRSSLDANGFHLFSDIPSANFEGLRFNFSTQQYAYGDVANASTGWVAGLSVTSKIFVAGDAGGVGNGTVLFLNDVSKLAAIGDPSQVGNGVSFFCDNTSKSSAGLGKVGGVTGAAFLLDFANDSFGLGDINSVWNHTKFYVDDANKTVAMSGYDGAVTALMFKVNADASINNLKLLAGWGAGANETSGLRNAYLGPGSGTIVQSSDDNTFVGWGAGGGSISAAVYRNVMIGTLAGSGFNDADATLIGYNTGASSGSVGALAIGSGAHAFAPYQASFGSESVPQIQYVFYKGAALSSNADANNVRFRKTSATGTNQSTSMWEFDTGDSTGSKGAGPFVFYVAQSGSSGTTTNLAQSNEIVRFNPDEVYLSKVIKGTPGSLTAANDLVFGNANISNVSGNTTINGLDANWINSLQFSLIFSGTLTLKHNTAPGAAFRKMMLAGSVDASVVPGCVFTFVYDSLNDVFRESGRTYP